VKPRLLLHLADGRDHRRHAVAASLAGAAARAGWRFDAYTDTYRRGRHFGGGDPAAAAPGDPAGGLVAGGRHLERVSLLAAAYEVVAVGDPGSVLWPALRLAGVEDLGELAGEAAVYAGVLRRLGLPCPETVFVLDAREQGAHRVVTAPYAYPAVLAEGGLALEVGAGDQCDALDGMGVRRYRPVWVDAQRAAAFPRSLGGSGASVGDRSAAEVTAAMAREHEDWGRGILLGDPDLVAGQVPKAARLRLTPLYGRPQTAVIERCRDLVAGAAEPVYGRQYDDHDFVALARLGHGLQVLDPAPPFDAAAGLPLPAPPAHPDAVEPDDDQLAAWAEDGRVLSTLLFWAGMVRELDCVPAILDVVASTGLRAGIVVTEDTVSHGLELGLSLLGVPSERGGVLGHLDVLVGSTGRGVAAEGLMPEGSLAASLTAARTAIAAALPPALEPRGWWPLLDTDLVPHGPARVRRRGLRPVVRFTPRGPAGQPDGGGEGDGDGRGRRVDARALAGRALRSTGLIRLLEESRPFDDRRPGMLQRHVLEAVAAAGFSYQWTKAGFGTPAVAGRCGDLVALPFTAGNWDGWSPFYTVATAGDLVRAERGLLRRGRPGWLASTVDTPLWGMSGELVRHGHRLHDLAELTAAGGRSGALINTTPGVVARYARLLDAEGLGESSRTDR
jgi:hypothetical protein